MVYYLFGWEFLAGSWAQQVVLVLSLVTVFMGSALALKEDTLKNRLAYSTVSQVSYVVFGLMLLAPGALEGAHVPGGLSRRGQKRPVYGHRRHNLQDHLTQASQMRGVGTVHGATMWCFALAGLSLIGIPPTGAFFSKWLLAQGGAGVGGGSPRLGRDCRADGFRPADGGLSACPSSPLPFPGNGL